jgi:hypothetical protein
LARSAVAIEAFNEYMQNVNQNICDKFDSNPCLGAGPAVSCYLNLNPLFYTCKTKQLVALVLGYGLSLSASIALQATDEIYDEKTLGKYDLAFDHILLLCKTSGS